MIDKYTKNLPVFKPYHAPTAGAVVLLTGSTGGLGSHILASLLTNPAVVEVITLNRGSNVAERQRASFEERGLSTSILSSHKLISIVGDMKHPELGLNSFELRSVSCVRLSDFSILIMCYLQVRNGITHIIHNAWRVDFNLSLSSFDTYIGSVRNLVDFSATCDHPVRLLFTSSAAAVYSWDFNKGVAPDDVIDDPNVVAASGYGQAKYVVEHVCDVQNLVSD